MSISSTTYRANYTGNGTASVFAVPFRILDDDHLLVTVRDSVGTETALARTTDYTVSGVGAATGSITMVNASRAWLTGGNLSTGYDMSIVRNVPLTQPTDIRNQGAFYPETHEDAFDRGIMIAQQQQDDLDRGIRLPVTIDPADFDPEVPASIVDQPGAILQVNSDGNGWTVGASTVVGTTVSSFAETYLDDLNAADTRTTLGFAGTGGTVQAANLEADAVTTAKILDANVTTAKIADEAVTLAKVAPAAISILAPSGLLAPYAGASAPTGWLLCDGSAVNRTTYADLYTAIGTTFGTGDGSTTFNVPNMRGRSAIGAGAGTLTESVAFGDVDTGNDYFTVLTNNTKWVTGMAVVLTTTGGLPAGLSLATTYYVVRSTSARIKFASSLANAQNGTVIDLTTQGTGTHTVTHTLTTRTLGELGGEESHAMTSTELLSHFHGILTTPASSGVGEYHGGANNAGVNTLSTGGNAAMNVMNPFLALNYIIKT